MAEAPATSRRERCTTGSKGSFRFEARAIADADDAMEDWMEQASSSVQVVALPARWVVLLGLELAGVGVDVADD